MNAAPFPRPQVFREQGQQQQAYITMFIIIVNIGFLDTGVKRKPKKKSTLYRGFIKK
jgi:hypothetical protein